MPRGRCGPQSPNVVGWSQRAPYRGRALRGCESLRAVVREELDQGWLKVCPRFPDEVAGQLEPAATLEDDVEHDSEGSHREDRERVTQFPAEFGHVLEVHAVDGAYQGRREENGGPGRDAFDVVVLVEAGLGQPFDLIVWR